MKNKFPDKIPVFPLNGVIFFPKTNLPLNIFENRYLDLVNDTMKKDKLMGMIQSKQNSNDVYNVGCLGKISDYQKAEDNRIIVNLTGVTRFEIKNEILGKKKYREFEVNYDRFENDLNINNDEILKIDELEFFIEKTKKFFKRNGLILNWKEFEKLDQNQQVNTLAMIAPISNEEKQKLLETITTKDKKKTLINIIDFYFYENNLEKTTIQ